MSAGSPSLDAAADRLAARLLAAHAPDHAYGRRDLDALPAVVSRVLALGLDHTAGALAREAAVPETPWLDASDPALRAAAEAWAEAARGAVRYPAEAWGEALAAAAHVALRLLVYPADGLAAVAFDGADGARPADEVLARVRAASPYAYLPDVAARYAERKEIDALDRPALDRLLARIDRRMADTLAPDDWLALAEPLFETVGPDGDPPGTLPAALVQAFLEARGQASRAAALLDAPITREALREATAEPLPTAVEHDAVEHDAVEHDAVEHDAVEHDAVEHDAVEHDAVEHDAVEHDAVEHDAVEHDADDPSEADPADVPNDDPVADSIPVPEPVEMPHRDVSGPTLDVSAALAPLEPLDAPPADPVERAEPDATWQDVPSPSAPAATPAPSPVVPPAAPPPPALDDTDSDEPLWRRLARHHEATTVAPAAPPPPADGAEPPPLWQRFSSDALPTAPASAADTLASRFLGDAPGALAPPARPAAPGAPASAEARVLGPAAERRDWFVSELFAGDRAAYDATLAALDAAASWTEATQIIAADVFRRYRVTIYSDPAVAFTDAVEAQMARREKAQG